MSSLGMLRSSILISAIAATVGHAQEDFVERFETINPKLWHIAEYDFTHPSFDTDWRRDNAFARDGLHLRLHPHSGGHNRFAGASLRTQHPLHFGRYSAQLKAARGEGLVTGVFTYTGPYYGTRHDEIDIEILGKDTTIIHLAWFVDGRLFEADIPLEFDAADCFHRYHFDWEPDRIAWFVNGKMVFEVTKNQAPIPQIPGHMFANLWAADPSISSWAGHAHPEQRSEAQIKELRFTPLNKNDLSY